MTQNEHFWNMGKIIPLRSIFETDFNDDIYITVDTVGVATLILYSTFLPH